MYVRVRHVASFVDDCCFFFAGYQLVRLHVRQPICRSYHVTGMVWNSYSGNVDT